MVLRSFADRAKMGVALKTVLKRYRLRWQLARQTQRRIVVGASGIYPPGWVPTDINTLNLLRLADWNAYFAEASIDAILAEHVWEHLSAAEGLIAALHCFRYLKPGGYLRVAVPDGLHPDQHYIAQVRPGGTGAGADDHQLLYTYRSATALFAHVGFQVRLLEYFDEAGNFHFHDWAPSAGMIRRSRRFDPRNAGGVLAYTSLILDAVK